MHNWQEMLEIPDSPCATPPSDSGSLYEIPDSVPSSPIRTDKDLSEGTAHCPYIVDSASLFDIPGSRPLTPSSESDILFSLPSSRPPTPMLVDATDGPQSASRPTPSTAPSQPSPSTPQPSQPQAPGRHNTPPINGRNLVPFLPIITSRAALLRGALAERRAEREYVRSRVDSVLQDMAELQRQLDAMDAFRVIKAAERQKAVER